MQTNIFQRFICLEVCIFNSLSTGEDRNELFLIDFEIKLIGLGPFTFPLPTLPLD